MKSKTTYTYTFSVEMTGGAVASPTPPQGPWGISWLVVRVAGVLVALAGLTVPYMVR